jgi:two-component system chemotaxis response regulator CheB
MTLDVEMPRMDGITFLEKLMRAVRSRVVMVSSLTERRLRATTLRALELGAIDFVTKPLVGIARALRRAGAELTEKVKMAAALRLPRATGDAGAADACDPRARMRTTQRIIAIGASTGGTEAIREFLAVLPADAPGIVIVAQTHAGEVHARVRRPAGRLCACASRKRRTATVCSPATCWSRPATATCACARRRRRTSFGWARSRT